jgi:hypothetical protein
MNRRSGGTVAQSGGAVAGATRWKWLVAGTSRQSGAGDWQAVERRPWAVGVVARGYPDADGAAVWRLIAAGVWWPVPAIRGLWGHCSE